MVFPSQEVTALSPAPCVPRAAQYMAAMGLWRPLVGPDDTGPVPVSSCNACMNGRYCFPNECICHDDGLKRHSCYCGRGSACTNIVICVHELTYIGLVE